MLSVTGIWLYMLATTFLTGYGILQALTRYVPYRVRHKDTYLLCGLAAVTVYAQLFSLVWRVGLLANLLLTAICLIILWFERRSLALLLRETLRDRRGKAAGIFALFLLFAYGTSRGSCTMTRLCIMPRVSAGWKSTVWSGGWGICTAGWRITVLPSRCQPCTAWPFWADSLFTVLPAGWLLCWPKSVRRSRGICGLAGFGLPTLPG